MTISIQNVLLKRMHLFKRRWTKQNKMRCFSNKFQRPFYIRFELNTFELINKITTEHLQ